jgi:hypothetical protein
MSGIGDIITIFIDAIFDAILLLLLSGLIPAMQCLVPGSDNSIWPESSYLFLVLIIILFSIWRVLEKSEITQ